MSNTLLVRIWTFYRDGFREMTPQEKQQYVGEELIKRANP